MFLFGPSARFWSAGIWATGCLGPSPLWFSVWSVGGATGLSGLCWRLVCCLVRHLGGVSWSRLFPDSRSDGVRSGLRVSIGALVCVWYVVWSCPVACPGPIAYSYLRETPPQHLPFGNTKVTAVMKVGRPAEQS
jgi:hypothetical protein